MNGSDAINPQVERAALIARLEDLRTKERTATPERQQEIKYQIGKHLELLQKLEGAIKSHTTVEPYAVESSPVASYQEPDLEDEEWWQNADRKLKEGAAERTRQERLTAICKDCQFTDIGNATRFTIRHHRDVRYCHLWKKWLLWDGQRWAIDTSDKIIGMAKAAALKIADEAKLADPKGNHKPEDVYRWAATTQSHPRINAMVALAQPDCALLPDQVDANHHLLNFPNGTLDLSTVSFREHRRDDLCTKIMGTLYDPADACPLWLDHLNTVFAGDETFIHSFQLMCGYSLIADNPEQILFVLHGSGKNGKSVTIGALRSIWGDYAWNMAADTLMARKHSDASTPRSDLAALQGIRLATASESDGGTRLSEATVKILTGGDDVMTVRRLYSEEFTFKPGAKVWLITNHLPTIRGTDEAIWRRIWLIPFNVTIPEEKRDPRMGERLQEEAPGILNWCLAGFREYMQAGRLVRPEIVAQATAEYREDQDILGDYFKEKCVLGPNYSVTAGELYKAYTQWCAWNEEKPLNKNAFGRRMKGRFVKAKENSIWYYHGVKVAEQSNLPEKPKNESQDKIGQIEQINLIREENPHKDKIKHFSTKLNNLSESVQNPVKSRSDLIKKYDLPADLDLNGYIRFTAKDARCLCKGCGQIAMWQGPDKALPRPFCDVHYAEMKASTEGDPHA